MITQADVAAAARRLAGVAHRTPILTSRTLNERCEADIFLKAENLQRAGAFKFRGAYNHIAALSPAGLGRGVATYSSGNHAQAVALAAGLLGVESVIVMPGDAPAAKAEATRAYGAEIITYDRYTADRAALAAALARERGHTLVPPYDHPLIIAGQGTAALELLEERSGLDALVVPVGGGGLIAGCATVAKAHAPGVRIVGVEPAEGDDTKQSLDAGRRIRITVPRTIADGQQIDMPGEITFEINRRLVDEVVTVTDEEIVAAMIFAFDFLKTVLEPSGASALAALLSHKVDLKGRVGVILSGGNVGADRFAELVGRAAS